MLDNNTIIKITNRNNSYIGYTVPELNNLHRRFAPNETKEVTMDELRKLSYVPGGSVILQNYLIINNIDAANELVPGAEPEYFYTEADVKALLINGSLDQLKDALDFAPDGVIALIKSYAVDLELNDVRKRDAIYEKTGFNVTKAIENNILSKATEESTENDGKARRAAPISAEAAPTEA